jgi:hypothetical protein
MTNVAQFHRIETELERINTNFGYTAATAAPTNSTFDGTYTSITPRTFTSPRTPRTPRTPKSPHRRQSISKTRKRYSVDKSNDTWSLSELTSPIKSLPPTPTSSLNSSISSAASPTRWRPQQRVPKYQNYTNLLAEPVAEQKQDDEQASEILSESETIDDVNNQDKESVLIDREKQKILSKGLIIVNDVTKIASKPEYNRTNTESHTRAVMIETPKIHTKINFNDFYTRNKQSRQAPEKKNPIKIATNTENKENFTPQMLYNHQIDNPNYVPDNQIYSQKDDGFSSDEDEKKKDVENMKNNLLMNIQKLKEQPVTPRVVTPNPLVTPQSRVFVQNVNEKQVEPIKEHVERIVHVPVVESEDEEEVTNRSAYRRINFDYDSDEIHHETRQVVTHDIEQNALPTRRPVVVEVTSVNRPAIQQKSPQQVRPVKEVLQAIHQAPKHAGKPVPPKQPVHVQRPIPAPIQVEQTVQQIQHPPSRIEHIAEPKPEKIEVVPQGQVAQVQVQQPMIDQQERDLQLQRFAYEQQAVIEKLNNYTKLLDDLVKKAQTTFEETAKNHQRSLANATTNVSSTITQTVNKTISEIQATAKQFYQQFEQLQVATQRATKSMSNYTNIDKKLQFQMNDNTKRAEQLSAKMLSIEKKTQKSLDLTMNRMEKNRTRRLESSVFGTTTVKDSNFDFSQFPDLLKPPAVSDFMRN